MISVGIIGVLAAIAIPAFTKYFRYVKYAEAPLLLQTLVNAEVSFFNKPRVDTNGRELGPCYLKTHASMTAISNGTANIQNKHTYVPDTTANILAFNVASKIYFDYSAN